MNQREIREELRKEASEHTPDVYDRIVSAAEAQKNRRNSPIAEGAEHGQRNRSPQRRRRTFARLAVVCTAAVLCLAVAVPVIYHAFEPIPPVAEVPSDGTAVRLSAEELYGLGAVTTVSLLGSSLQNEPSRVSALSSVCSAKQSTTMQAQAEQFHTYFLMLESFLGEGILNTSAVPNTDEAYAAYEIKLTVTGTDLYGNEISHLMYYTETVVKEKEEKNESESEYEISGIMVTKEENYALKGERSVKTQNKGEDAEREEEFRIRAYPDSSRRNTYVEMKQELSVEGDAAEQRYVYSVVKNGSVTESTAIRFESQTKDDRTEIDYRIEFLSGRAKGEYRLEKEIKDGGTQMRVKYSVDGDSGYFTIEETADGEYVYTFSDGTVKRFQS